MKWGEGFVLVYSITSRESLRRMEDFQTQIGQVTNKKYFPMVLVGSKCDLEEQREVTFGEGEALAQKFICPFFEASALTRVNVQEIFAALIKEIRKRNTIKNLDQEVSPNINPCVCCPCVLL
jgi:GTPase KRas protein